MNPKFTNDYTILKDIIKVEYSFVLSLLFTNFAEIIHLMKEKMPLDGEVLEYVYSSVPSYYNSKHDSICHKYRYVDSVIRIIYKNRKDHLCATFHRNVKNICKDFHIEVNELSYYYFIALVIVYLESSINIDAYNLYTQLSDDVIKDIQSYLNDLLDILDINEFYGLFYNHLEDVYHSNVSIDEKVSLIHKDNYSFFLDNFDKSRFFELYMPINDMYRYPIIITDEFIYCCTKDKKLYMLQSNTIEAPIFTENVKYVASYYPCLNTIKHWIPFFNLLHPINDKALDASLLDDLYNQYSVHYKIDDVDTLTYQTSNFYIFNGDLTKAHYYVDVFTVFDESALQSRNNAIATDN